MGGVTYYLIWAALLHYLIAAFAITFGDTLTFAVFGGAAAALSVALIVSFGYDQRPRL